VDLLGFAPDGKALWISLANGVVEARSWPDLCLRSPWQNVDSYATKGSRGIECLAVGARWVLVGTHDPATKLLRAGDAQKEREWPSPGGFIQSVALSPDETLAVSGTKQGIVQVVRTANGTSVAELTSHRLSVDAVTFSPDGTWLATGSGDRTVRLWQRRGESFQEALTLRQAGPVIGLRFHPDGKKLAVVMQGERAVRVWHLDRLQEQLTALGLGW
jgi:WD40 repeat protein